MSSGGLILAGLTALDVTSVASERVELDGVKVDPVVPSGSDGSREWTMRSVLSATPAESVVILRRPNLGSDQWVVVGCAGILPSSDQKLMVRDNSPILSKYTTGYSKESYLPTVQALPGKVEFTYLPNNVQGVLIVPTEGGVMVLGSDVAKSFSPRDVVWCTLVASWMDAN
eukprot:CAMPEP_0194320714 /NCGR_PEP_ID=MMETSP0171-20130528/16988_1 /TAXON_ID=218684 /ORGANISM="Corethron pennatum, Strain L29A3" /LENGTH=170 /DNA_ID=CAMNT_0039078321 /DNA_START=421 /DNA_END=933 /DNA_ORIENTATION=+